MSKTIILLIFIHGFVFTVAKEPSCKVCSSFDYEQRLLERVLRNELALENLIKEIKETNVKVTGVLADVDEKRTTLSSALEKAKHDIQNIVQDYRQINTSIRIVQADVDEKRTTLNSDLEKAKHDIQNIVQNYRKINTSISIVQADVDEKRTTLNSDLEKAKHDIQNIVQDYRNVNKSISILQEKAHATPIVYFRARMPATNTPTHIVVFAQVDVNKGQGYDKVTGKFTAPVAGLYMFSVQFCVETNQWAHLGIFQDDKLLSASSHYGPDNNEECVTFQVFTAVANGNKVWVQVTSGTAKLYHNEHHWHTSFTGALIRS